jgi:hypothetical protein
VVLKRFLPLALAGAVLLGSGCGDTVSPALRVGDTTVSYDALYDEFDEWAGNPALQQQFGTRGQSPGSYSTDVTSRVINFRIQSELVRAEAERRGIGTGDADRNQAREALYGDPQNAEQIEGGFSSEYAEQLLDGATREIALAEELGQDGFIEWITEAVAEERIEVSSRFGRWDPELQQVVPPTGPTTTASPAVAPAVPPAPGV